MSIIASIRRAALRHIIARRNRLLADYASQGYPVVEGRQRGQAIAWKHDRASNVWSHSLVVGKRWFVIDGLTSKKEYKRLVRRATWLTFPVITGVKTGAAYHRSNETLNNEGVLVKDYNPNFK